MGKWQNNIHDPTFRQTKQISIQNRDGTSYQRRQKEVRIFLHRVKRSVDKCWPDDMNGIEAAKQNAERDAQARRNESHIHRLLAERTLSEIPTTKSTRISWKTRMLPGMTSQSK